MGERKEKKKRRGSNSLDGIKFVVVIVIIKKPFYLGLESHLKTNIRTGGLYLIFLLFFSFICCNIVDKHVYFTFVQSPNKC